MPRQTPLYSAVRQANGKIVDFFGWEMAIHFGSQLNEHHAVRQHSGLFDVSHMSITDVSGDGARDFLRQLLANDVAKIDDKSRGLYSCLLNETGGVIDDLIVCRRAANHYRIVSNAGTEASVRDWLTTHCPHNVTLTPQTDLAMLALQGPHSRDILLGLLPANIHDTVRAMRPFDFCDQDPWFIANTGYTGEDGFELILDADLAQQTWTHLLEQGVQPCGLGARDTLRLEAGLNLYGQDMDSHTHPYESNLGWTVCERDSARNFIGKSALHAIDRDHCQQLVGLYLPSGGILRAGQTINIDGGAANGVVTSGSFAPTLQAAIGLARLPQGNFTTVDVLIRAKALRAYVVKPPFVKQGKILIDVKK